MSNDVKEQIIKSALILHQSGNLPEAERLYLEILTESPNDGNALNLLGFLKIQNKQFDEAINYLKKALKIYPDFFEAWFNLGLAYKNNNQFDNAIKAYENALSIEPNNTDVYFNIASVYEEKNDAFAAINYYEKARECKAGVTDNDINYFLGCAYLKTKNFEKGLNFYEYRSSKDFAIFTQKLQYKDLITSKPLWAGEAIKNKTLFVYYEAALGDTLMYVRYLSLLKNLCSKVLFKPQECFIDFFKENNFGAEIIENRTLPEDIVFDVHIPLMSLPYVLKLNTDIELQSKFDLKQKSRSGILARQHEMGNALIETRYEKEIPLSEGYLKASPQKVKTYKEKYFNNDKRKIGIKWKGNATYGLNRIIQPEFFYKLFDLPDIQFYSVQKGDGEEELEKIRARYNIINLGETFSDFSDTAAAVENLDLVICNDTSVAHLAGAMGKPCWVLLPFVPNWRWHTDLSYSPWYKSVKLFKQSEPDNWEEVFDRVYEGLKLIYF